jgi:hypothetical protein
MKNQSILSIILTLILVCPAFSQDKTIKTDISPRYINQLSPIMSAEIPDEVSKPDSSHAYYFPSDTDSSYTNTTIYSYDKSGNLISDYTSIYHRDEFDYNEKNLMIEHRVYDYDGDNSLVDSMLPVNRIVFSYDKKDKIKSISSFGWDFETKLWIPDTSSKEEYSYNNEGQLSRIYSYSYGPEKQIIPNNTLEYSFNKSTNCLTELNKSYYNWKSAWEVSDSTLYYVNDDSLCILIDNYGYNSNDSSWYQWSKTEASYNDKGNMICTTYGEYWAGYFLPNYKFNYIYNESDQLIYQSEVIWNYYNQIWNNIYSTQYFYSGLLQKANENSVTGLKLNQEFFKNNIQSDAIADGSEITVYSMNGAKLIQHKYSGEYNPVSELPAGNYLIRITKNNTLLLSKVIFKK